MIMNHFSNTVRNGTRFPVAPHKKPLIASRSLSGFLIYIPTTKCRTIKYSEDYSNKATYSAHYTRIYKWTITVNGICKGV